MFYGFTPPIKDARLIPVVLYSYLQHLLEYSFWPQQRNTGNGLNTSHGPGTQCALIALMHR